MGPQVLKRFQFGPSSSFPLLNPFLPTGQIFAPKLIMLIKCVTVHSKMRETGDCLWSECENVQTTSRFLQLSNWMKAKCERKNASLAVSNDFE